MALTADRLRQVLFFDKETGEFFWKEKRPGGIEPGDKAGRINGNGYDEISIDCVRYKAHRLAWLYVYDKWPEKNLDHIDGNRSNNKISNLREATQSQNMSNRSKTIINTSGYKGVHFRRKKFEAYIRILGKRIDIGRFNSAEAAAIAYDVAAYKYFGEFAKPNGIYEG